MKRYSNFHNKKDEKNLVRCVLELISSTNLVRYIRINTKFNSYYSFNFSRNSILHRFIQDRYNFPQLYEMLITFDGCFREKTYDYYLEQALPMCEFRVNQILAKNPRHI